MGQGPKTDGSQGGVGVIVGVAVHVGVGVGVPCARTGGASLIAKSTHRMEAATAQAETKASRTIIRRVVGQAFCCGVSGTDSLVLSSIGSMEFSFRVLTRAGKWIANARTGRRRFLVHGVLHFAARRTENRGRGQVFFPKAFRANHSQLTARLVGIRLAVGQSRGVFRCCAFTLTAMARLLCRVMRGAFAMLQESFPVVRGRFPVV